MDMSDNWVVQNLQNALTTWNEKLAEIWVLLTEEPEHFRGGDIWKVIVDIHGALQAIGIALLVLFFLAGMVKESGSFAEVKRPEQAVKVFIRFIIAKASRYLRTGAHACDFCNPARHCRYDYANGRAWQDAGHAGHEPS